MFRYTFSLLTPAYDYDSYITFLGYTHSGKSSFHRVPYLERRDVKSVMSMKPVMTVLSLIPYTAHARLMFRETVTVEDAVVVVSVMECSMQVSSV